MEIFKKIWAFDSLIAGRKPGSTKVTGEVLQSLGWRTAFNAMMAENLPSLKTEWMYNVKNLCAETASNNA